MSRRKWIFTSRVVRPESKYVTHWMPSVSIYNNSLGLSSSNDRAYRAMRDSISFPSSNFDHDISNRFFQTSRFHRGKKNLIFFHVSSPKKFGEHFQRFLSFFLSFFFNPKTLESHSFFFFFFSTLIFSKSWPIKNLLALNANEISLTGAKLFPAPASWNSSPSRKRLRARRKERGEGRGKKKIGRWSRRGRKRVFIVLQILLANFHH